MKIFSGNSNKPLAEAICNSQGLRLGDALVRRFADQEVFVEILENVRGEDVFFIQSTSYPANDNVMELLVAIDALKRGSARRITALIPYYGYARQDRKSGPRTPISAKLVANLLTVAGADRCLTVDLHAGQIQGFFDIPLDNLYTAPVFVRDIKKLYDQSSLVIVSPDVGGVQRVRIVAEALRCGIAIIDKRRSDPGVAEAMNVIGEVAGKQCVIVDDIVDSAGTLVRGVEALMKKGAKRVSAYVTHGVLSGEAVKKVAKSPLDRLVVTDSIAADSKTTAKIERLSIAPLLGEAIRRINEEESVSSLFRISDD